MLTIIPAKIPYSDLCRSFSNTGTVTKPGASDGRLMLKSPSEKLLLTMPPMFVLGAFRFYGICRQNKEPTSGLEPLT